MQLEPVYFYKPQIHFSKNPSKSSLYTPFLVFNRHEAVKPFFSFAFRTMLYGSLSLWSWVHPHGRLWLCFLADHPMKDKNLTTKAILCAKCHVTGRIGGANFYYLVGNPAPSAGNCHRSHDLWRSAYTECHYGFTIYYECILVPLEGIWLSNS